MNMYPQYKSKSGYYINNDGIDSYGVNHKNFTTRDELEYQFARVEKEKQINNNKDGILYAQNNNTNVMSDADDNFNRVFSKTLNEEGGYEYRPNKIDTPTNMGIQQKTLDRFKLAHPQLSKEYPENVKDLTYQQGRQIAKIDYFDKYRIGEITHKPLQETVFDSVFNHSPVAPILWLQRAINKNSYQKIDEDGILGSKTIQAINKLSPAEVVTVNNSILDQRQADYEYQKRTNSNPNYNNYTVGLPNRFNHFRIK